MTRAVHLKEASPIHYSLKKTGYYCVVTEGFTIEKYKAVVEFRNAYGELPATQIPKLPFYGAMSIIYALIASYWTFLYYQHRHDICMGFFFPVPLAPRKLEMGTIITCANSGRPKLHHGYIGLSCGGNAHYLGILWFVLHCLVQYLANQKSC